MRFVVIGGTRFIGRCVVRQLIARGHEVIVFHRGKVEGDLPASVLHVHGDRLALPGNLHGDVVIDMWCMTEQHARSAAEHFRDERYVVLSSGDVYRQYDGLQGRSAAPPDRIPLAEDAPVREKLYPYRDKVARVGDDLFLTYDKLLVERALASPRTTVLRLPAVYGPHDEQHRFEAWLDGMDGGAESIAIDEGQANWHWTRGYVDDVAEGIVAAAFSDRAAGRTYNVGESDAPTDAAWLEMLGRAAGWKGRIVRERDVPGTLPLNWTYHLVMDTSRIREELAWTERVPREEALARLVAWRRAQRSSTTAALPS